MEVAFVHLCRPFRAGAIFDDNPGRRSQTRFALGWLVAGPLALAPALFRTFVRSKRYV